MVPDWPIGTGWPIGNGLADRHQIGSGLARIGSDWLGLANWRICVVQKIDARLASDWHGLGPDWHRLDPIGYDWQIGKYWRNGKFAPDWHRIGSGLASIGLELAQDWHRIGIDWLGIGT